MKINPLDHPICFETPQRVAGSNAWVEHIPFAFFIIDIIRPRVLVELGTYAGNSYCAFCQAIQTLNLDAKAYAVDTWEGDEHGGFYGPGILSDLRAHHDPNYASFSRLMQMTFDEAKSYFSDGTIDMLHIDGLHTYESVKHDFENWHPKLSENAVVLFHDINVKERDFGVWKFWEELKKKYRHLEFFHGNGLGVLAINGSFSVMIEDQLELDSGTSFRQFFSYLGGRTLFSIENKDLRQLVNQKTNQYQQLVVEHDALKTSVEEELLKNQIFQAEKEVLSMKVQQCQINIDNHVTKIDDLERQLAVYQHQIDELESTMSNILLSKSWTITRPFRKILGKS